MKKIFKNLRAVDYLTFILIIGLVVGLVYLEFEVTNYMKQLTPLIKIKAPIKEIWNIGLKMLLCAVGSMGLTIITGYFTSRLAVGFSMRLRANVFSTVESFSLAEIKRFSTASLITRSTNDVNQLQMFLSMGTTVIIRAPITVIFALSNMVKSSWQYSVITAVGVGILLVAITIAITLALPRFRKMQTLTDNLNRVTRENLEGVRVVKAFNAETYEAEKFEKANDEMTKNSTFAGRVMALLDPVMGLVMQGLTLAIFMVGAVIISKLNAPFDELEFYSIVVFSRYASQVVMSFMLLTMVFVMMPRAVVSIRRLSEVLNTKSNITSGEFNGETEEKGTIVFNGVHFKYPDAEEEVLSDINFKIGRGESVAFIGSTGSGKSTLINLIPRLYDITGGQILIDGVDIKDYDLTALRNKIGYISQRAIMFSGTIKDNLVFGENGKPEQSDEELTKSLNLACADFVSKMDGGLNAEITQGGTNVSGGQKQRLSIARGLARDPEILIFDDTFSALDFKTDKKVRKNLKKELAGVTKLIVAQRIGTIKDCDQIVVLNEGKVVGIGKHADLLSTCPVYKEIALSQLSEEEL